jgi:DNA-binding transcriptional LysR family regulator
MLEARHLRIVRAISDTGSLTKAAVELGLTQPALTHQLHRMERLFGGALFVRDRRGARPTPLGQHVIERARFVLPSMDALVREARILAGGQDTAVPQIRVATHPSPLPVAVVAALREALPHSQVNLRTEPSAQRQLELLASGALEVAILAEYPSLPMPRPAEVVVHEVATEPPCRRNLPLRGRRRWLSRTWPRRAGSSRRTPTPGPPRTSGRSVTRPG